MAARQELQVQDKRELEKKEEATIPARVFLPTADIYETRDALTVILEMPGVEKNNVEEYCVSEGWVRVTAGNAKDRYGNPLTIKVHGPVEPYFRDKK